MSTTWTDDQKEAIWTRGASILVSAAAGSGKTAVLVERIYSMLTDTRHPVNIENLLVVTFTNAAAAEMKERIEERLAKSLEEDPENDHLAGQLAGIGYAQIMTIHSFCLWVIRNHFQEIGLDPSFRVGDDTQLQLMREEIVREIVDARYEQGDPEFAAFAESFAPGKTDAGLEELILKVYRCSMSYPQPRQWLGDCLKSFSVEDAKELEELPAVRFLLQYVRSMLDGIDNILDEAISICRQEDGPLYYEDALQSDRMIAKTLRECGTFDEYQRALSGISFESLSRKRMPACAPEKKEQVKNLRDTVKNILKNLKEDYFFADADTMAADLRSLQPHMQVLVELTENFSDAYQERKSRKNLIDFNDQEHYALQILTRSQDGRLVPSETAKELARQYQEILVDEYQDSNLVQETILTSISGESTGHPNMFMVGDVKQSIYKFRLARPELFMEKYRTYPAKGPQYRRIDLKRNFRSRENVLNCVNFIFGRLMAADLGDIDYDADAALYKGAQYPDAPDTECAEVLLVTDEDTDGSLIHVEMEDFAETDFGTDAKNPAESAFGADAAVRAESDTDAGKEQWKGVELEAHAVAARIREMACSNHPLLVTDQESGRLRPVRYGDIVILLRTMAGWSDIFVRVLGEENISAQAETSKGFFSAPEIQVILAFLRTIDNPRQDIPLTAVLKSPVYKVTDEQLAMIAGCTGPRRERSALLYDCCLYAMEEDHQASLSKQFGQEAVDDLRESLGRALTQLESFRGRAAYMSIHELILAIYEETGYALCAQAMPGGDKRRANLDMLVQKAVDYENTGSHGLFQFVRYIEKLESYEVDFGEAPAAESYTQTVRVMSIHKSKGLEFPVVIAAGMGKAFNLADARSQVVIHSEYGFGPNVTDPWLRTSSPTLMRKILAKKTVLETLGEEIRVWYVAMTRAREKLILCGHVKDPEPAIRKWLSAGAGEDPGFLPFQSRQSAGCVLDWVMEILVNHRGAHTFLNDYGYASPILSPWYDDPSCFLVRRMRAGDLRRDQAVLTVRSLRKKQELLDWNPGEVYQEDIHTQIDTYLDWTYPFDREKRLHPKMSVTELKRQSQLPIEGEDEGDYGAGIGGKPPEESVYADKGAKGFRPEDSKEVRPEGTKGSRPEDSEDLQPKKPGESKAKEPGDGKETSQETLTRKDYMERAAFRGTTMHKLLQNIDIRTIHSLEDARVYIRTQVEEGEITQEGAQLISAWSLFAFARSPLAARMAAAASRHSLYQEKQFVMGVPASQVDPSMESDEMILIQGVIDAWFIEEGKIVIVDYKTDYAADDGTSLIQKYKTQLDYYALALEQITQLEVKEKLIYSLRLHRELIVV